MFLHLPKFPASGALFALLFPLLVGSSGCNRYSRTKQCRALIAQINPALDEVTALTHGGAGAGSGSYVAAAGRYERLAKQLGPMEFASEDMAKTVAEYAGLLTTSALDLRNLATAIDSNNTVESDRINRELERISAHERSVVGRMDAWCQP
jgi:hypothetical protein